MGEGFGGVRDGGGLGINVTAPFKLRAFAMADERSEAAQEAELSAMQEIAGDGAGDLRVVVAAAQQRAPPDRQPPTSARPSVPPSQTGRSSAAPVSRSLPKTSVQCSNDRLVVTTRLWRS